LISLCCSFSDIPGSETTLTQQLIDRQTTRRITTVLSFKKPNVGINQHFLIVYLRKLTLKKDKVLKFPTYIAI